MALGAVLRRRQKSINEWARSGAAGGGFPAGDGQEIGSSPDLAVPVVRVRAPEQRESIGMKRKKRRGPQPRKRGLTDTSSSYSPNWYPLSASAASRACCSSAIENARPRCPSGPHLVSGGLVSRGGTRSIRAVSRPRRTGVATAAGGVPSDLLWMLLVLEATAHGHHPYADWCWCCWIAKTGSPTIVAALGCTSRAKLRAASMLSFGRCCWSWRRHPRRA